MKANEALRLAIREMADAACRRCQGSGLTGGDLIRDLCTCVSERVPEDNDTSEFPSANADMPADEKIPHPWGFITRRAEVIQTLAQIGAAPDRWS